MAIEITKEALGALKNLFAEPKATGAQMAVRAAGGLASGPEIAASSAVLSADLIQAIDVK